MYILTCLHIYFNIHIHIHIYFYIYLYMYIYICTYVYTHAFSTALLTCLYKQTFKKLWITRHWSFHTVLARNSWSCDVPSVNHAPIPALYALAHHAPLPSFAFPFCSFLFAWFPSGSTFRVLYILNLSKKRLPLHPISNRTLWFRAKGSTQRDSFCLNVWLFIGFQCLS